MTLRLTPEQLSALQAKVKTLGRIAVRADDAERQKRANERWKNVLKPQSAPKPSKYRNVKTDGFDSKREAARWAELQYLELGDRIRHLQKQVAFELIPAQYRDGKCVERACSYVADFTYDEYVLGSPLIQWEHVVEDAKGHKTADYIIKRKLMLQKYNIRIREV